MKVVLDMRDDKADFMLELLGYFDFVKIEKVSKTKKSSSSTSKKNLK